MEALWSIQSPLLPALWLDRGYLALAWGVVLAALGVVGLRWRGLAQARGVARWLPVLLLIWALLPGSVSPAYWLGLAFRAPSMLTTLLCAGLLLTHYRAQSRWPLSLAGLRTVAPVLVLAGWLLLLDAFAVWPTSLYALGYAPAMFALLLLLGLLPWTLRGAAGLSVVLTGALLLHLVLRLPTGNVWDVLLDPWLWLLLQVDWLRRMLHRQR